jgi:hypothetical protein
MVYKTPHRTLKNEQYEPPKNKTRAKKNQNNQNHHVIFRLFFLKFLKRKKKKKKKIIQNIYIFTIKSPKKNLKRKQRLKINIRLIDQFK